MQICLKATAILLLLTTAAWPEAPPDAAPAASPQTSAASPTANPSPAAIKVGDVTITGTLRARMYIWNWFQAATGQNQYQYSGDFLRVNLAEKRGNFDWDAELAVPFLLGLPSGATDAAPQGALGLGSNYYSANKNNNYAAMIFPRQLFARFRGLGGNEGQTLQAGRFVFQDGTELAPKNATLAADKQNHVAQRLLGDFAFSDVGRSFDGVHYSFSTPTSDFTFVSGVPTRGVYQVDGWGWNRIALGYAAFTKDWGHGNYAADTRLFAIDYDDFRHILKTDNRAVTVRRGDTENIHIQTWGGHSLHAFTTLAGTLDALGWGAVQTGRWGTQTQRAYAFDVEGGFQPAILPRFRPWIRGGYTMGSGDGNASDNRHETFFQILPTPRVYARFPFFNMMNTEDGYASLMLRPHPNVTITSEFHSLRLSSVNDLWYSGGGAFQPWTFGYTGRSTSGRRSLANLYDTSVDYRFSRAATFTAYLGYAQGLASIEKIYSGGTGAQFGYLEFLYRF
jgi:hypothetical protein